MKKYKITWFDRVNGQKREVINTYHDTSVLTTKQVAQRHAKKMTDGGWYEIEEVKS